jgi:hypothetical protein
MQVGGLAIAVHAHIYTTQAAVVADVAIQGEGGGGEQAAGENLGGGDAQGEHWRLGVEQEGLRRTEATGLAKAVGGLRLHLEEIAIVAADIPGARPSAVVGCGIRAEERARAAVDLQSNQRHAGVVVGVAAQGVDAGTDEVRGLSDAEELRRGVVHPVMRPQPIQGFASLGMGSIVEFDLHRGPGFGAERGIHHALEADLAHRAGTDVAQIDAIAARQGEGIQWGEVGVDAGSGVRAAVVIAQGIADGLAVADRRLRAVQEIQVRGDVGRSGLQEVLQPEEVVAQQTVGRAGRVSREPHLHVRVEEGLGRCWLVAAVGADARGQGVPVITLR